MNLGWFSTGRDQAARDLLSTVMRQRDQGLLDVDIVFAFCNFDADDDPGTPESAERQRFFELVRSYDIKLLTLSWKKLRASMKDAKKDEWRVCYGKKMRQLIYGNYFDLGILAGYNFWLDSDTCTRFDLVNLHPALPGTPQGTWQEIISHVVTSRAERHGAMMHLCTPKYEEGNVISYCSFPLTTPQYRKLWSDYDEELGKRSVDLLSKDEMEGTALFKAIRKDVERRELPLVTYTIKMFASGDVSISHGKLVANGLQLSAPHDLTGMVESAIGRGEF